MKYVLNRLKERSTVAGMLTFAMAFGITIEPGLADAIGSMVTAGAGLALAIIPTSKGE